MNRDELAKYLLDKFPDTLELLETGKAEPFFLMKKPDELVEFCRAIRDDVDLRMDYLCMMCGVDTGENFEVVFSVASIKKRYRFDFKFPLPYDKAEIDSVQTIWAGANWFERETWELYGINIRNHDNLTRFLLPDDWDQGFPMRKDWDAPDFKRLPEV